MLFTNRIREKPFEKFGEYQQKKFTIEWNGEERRTNERPTSVPLRVLVSMRLSPISINCNGLGFIDAYNMQNNL